jgi:hypothetical protein
MKKFILAICLIMGIATSQTIQGDEKRVDKEVILHDKSKVRQPRSVVLLPACWYHGFSNSVEVEFPDDNISFTAMVVNTSTGEQWFEMGNGYVEITISDAPGDYLIEIETDSDRSFYGNFTL